MKHGYSHVMLGDSTCLDMMSIDDIFGQGLNK